MHRGGPKGHERLVGKIGEILKLTKPT
jgi:hypothetical protein